MLKNLRVLLIVLAVLAAFSGAASAYEGAVAKKVDIDVDGKTISVNTVKRTVGEALSDAGVTITKDDIVQPDLAAEVVNDMQIYVNKAFMVTVNVDGSPRHLKVSAGTLKSAKEKIEAGIKTETQLVGANENDKLVPGMTIELVTSYTERDEEEGKIPFEVVYVENNEVDEGIETVLTEGADGVSVTVYESLYEGDKLVSRDVVETIVKQEPVDKVIEKGVKPPAPIVPDVPELKLTYNKVMTMRASAYTTDRGDSGPYTATGERARVGLVAVDPSVIPLGTLLYVENYGVCRAADTGGMIKGNAIDLFFNSYNECVNFGRRNVTVYVLDVTRDDLIVLETKDVAVVLEAA